MGLIWILAAALWGVAEATVFFVVPDVLITYAAVRWNFRAGLKLSLATALAAAAGGAVLWWWGAVDANAARAAMLRVPAIGPDLLEKARAGMAGANWPLNLTMGALSGTPYKLYAVEAGARGIDALLFVALSIPARLVRFVLTAALAVTGHALFKHLGIERWSMRVLALAWIIVYATYWIIRGL